MLLGDEACCVGEDEVVNVGVFERRVGVLPEAVEEEDGAEGEGESVEWYGGCEEGGCGEKTLPFGRGGWGSHLEVRREQVYAGFEMGGISL